MRLNISLDEEVVAISKQFAETQRLPFSGLISIALEHYLKAVGHIKEDAKAKIQDRIEEIMSYGKSEEEINAHLDLLTEEEVCDE